MIVWIGTAWAGDGCWAPPAGLDRSTSPLAYHEAPAVVSDAMLGASLGAAVAGPLTLDVRAGDWRNSVGALIAGGVTIAGFETAKATICRDRPYTYDGAAGAYRNGADDQRSFWSGHTAFAASTSFTLATETVLATDGKPWVVGLAYGSATAWTGVMGGLRVAAGKHFLSDVVVGGGLGAAAGVLVPIAVHAVGAR